MFGNYNYLGVQKNGQPVLLSELNSRFDLFRVVDHESFEGDVFEVRVECDLRFDQGAKAVVGPEEGKQTREAFDVFLDATVFAEGNVNVCC